jgi:hypothetical protein
MPARLSVIIAWALVVGCEENLAGVSDVELATALQTAVRGNPDTKVRLDAIAPGAWSTVYVFGPYTPRALIDRCMAYSSIRPDVHGIESRDDIELLIFRGASGGSHSVAVPRLGEGFVQDATSRRYDREGASFMVKKRRDSEVGSLVRDTSARGRADRCA